MRNTGSSVLLASMLTITVILSSASFPASASSPIPSNVWQSYISTMSHTPTPTTGCFVSTYPTTVWLPVACGSPLNVPANVGNGVDWSAQAGTGVPVGYANGLFTAITGLTSEQDSKRGTNYYSLQVNSNTYSATACPYGGHSTGYTCWEQFIFQANGCTGCRGAAFIEYTLRGYYTTYNSCPPGGPPNSSVWTPTPPAPNSKDCYSNSSLNSQMPDEPPSNLIHLSLAGSAAAFGSANDQVTFCDSTTGQCYTFSNTKTVLNLYQNWSIAEFNVFGYGDLSQANFNTPGVSMTINDNEEKSDGTVITPSCNLGGTTGETNNLNIVLSGAGVCGVSPSGILSFTESD